jgi:hypothetical protein
VIFEEYSNTIELFIFVAGGFGLLQKMADIERCHQTRVVVLTALFSLAMVLFYVTNVYTGPPLISFDTPEDMF